MHVYGIVMPAIQGVLLVGCLCVPLVDAGYPLPMPTLTMLAVGMSLMVLGSYMGKLRKNFFIAFARRGRWSATRSGSARTGWGAGCSCWPAW